jgi:hypothetical protein
LRTGRAPDAHTVIEANGAAEVIVATRSLDILGRVRGRLTAATLTCHVIDQRLAGVALGQVAHALLIAVD